MLLPAYLSHSSTRSPVVYLASLKPPTLVCSVVHDRLLFLCPLSADAEPLLVLELLHRITDVLEEFLGSPLLRSKIDSSYDVVAQIVSEMCDAGTISTTEPNALRETVEAPNWMSNILGGFGLPASVQTQYMVLTHISLPNAVLHLPFRPLAPCSDPLLHSFLAKEVLPPPLPQARRYPGAEPMSSTPQMSSTSI